MYKRKDKLLCFALIWSANNMRKHSYKIKNYYGIKYSQGKSHYNISGYYAAKLFCYIFLF